ncbi:MAG: hypothetical protein MJZ03_00255 [archaeon]|nr:hypothetical protein [archaeon]
MSINKKNSDGSYSQFAGMPYVTKDNIGLSKVENKNSEDIRGEITSKNIKDALGYTPANDVDEKKSQNDIAVLSSRMDGFTKLGEGSTTGDAELEDIRVAYDGKTYSNAGTAVRSQVSDLKETMDTISDALYIDNVTDDKTTYNSDTIGNVRLFLATIANACTVDLSVGYNASYDDFTIVIELWHKSGSDYIKYAEYRTTTIKGESTANIKKISAEADTYITVKSENASGSKPFRYGLYADAPKIRVSNTLTGNVISDARDTSISGYCCYKTVCYNLFDVSEISEAANAALTKSTNLESEVDEIKDTLYTETEEDKLSYNENSANNARAFIAKANDGCVYLSVGYNAVYDPYDLVAELWHKNGNSYTKYSEKSVRTQKSDGKGIADFEKIEISGETYISITARNITGSKPLLYSEDAAAPYLTVSTSLDGDTVTVKQTSIRGYYSYKIKKIESKATAKKTAYIVVDINGNGDYDNLNAAINDNAEGKVIYLMPGTYEVEPIRSGDKAIRIIGTDKTACKIVNYDGRYRYPPIEVSVGYFENITIAAEYVEGKSQEIGTGQGAYAVHVEDEFSKGKTLEFHNCVLYSDFSCAIGIGLRKEQTVILDNVTMENAQIVGRGIYTDNGSLGALVFHDSIGEGGNSYITVKDCLLKSSLGNSIAPSWTGNPESGVNKVYCTFINNTLYDKIHRYSNNVWLRNNPFENGFEFDVAYGNSASELNDN